MTNYRLIMNEVLKFKIPLSPISKKNSQRILFNHKTGRPFISPSKQYQEYEENAMVFIPAIRTIDYPCNIKCLFYLGTRRKCDLTNLLEAIDDILVKAGIIEDDNYTILAGHDGSRIFYDKNNPRTEVLISKMEEETK